jgi:hypothetical protein
MKLKKYLILLAAATLVVIATGCFRVSSETQALRDAALEFMEADEKIELGVGFFTLRLARFGTQFLELPPEAKLVLDAVDGAECSIYEIQGKKPDSAKVLARADKAMGKRGFDRIVGVADREQLVAVYVPRSTKSHRNMHISILVLDRKQLVCVKARGDLEPLVQIALEQVKQHLPARAQVASNL